MTNTYNKRQVLFSLFDKHGLSLREKEELLNIIEFIYQHDEFQRRLTTEFLHHDKITLGEHILEVTIMTYILSKKQYLKQDFNLDTAIKISMSHDLYTLPWQNNPQGVVNNFFNQHGFRHPIESVINANTWFPELFISADESKKIIDGVVHHMFPLPVTSFIDSKNNELELKNFDYIKNLSNINKQILIESSNRFKVDRVSITPSIYKEGRIVSNADKLISISNLKGSNLEGIKALVTGKNKNLKKN